MSTHPIVHVEISANDLQAASRFYAALFSWKIQQMPEMNYAMFDFGSEGMGGGLNPVQEGNPAGTVIVYVDCDDIDFFLAKVESLGGQTVTPKTEIPGMGWFGLFRDPTGNLIGLFTAIAGQS